MTEYPGWYLFLSQSATRKKWHYFATYRPLCGAATFKVGGDDGSFTAEMSWFYREKGEVCRRCANARRPVEDRPSESKERA